MQFLKEKEMDSQCIKRLTRALLPAMLMMFTAVGSARAQFSIVDFRQYENGALNQSHIGLSSPWINGILNPQHSAYAEGMSRPQRVIFTGLTTNGSGSVTHGFQVYHLD